MALIVNSYARSVGGVISTAILVLMAVLLAGCEAQGTPAASQPQPPAVDIAEVVNTPVTLWDDFTGRVEAPETVELRPRVSGYIDTVSFEEGELVAQGDVLFVIDQRPYQARERAAIAQLELSRSQLTLAGSEARRAERLLKARAISQEEYDQRAAALASARAAVNAAQADLDTARLDLEYTEVRAPINGRVGRAFVTRGNLANADSTRLTSLVSVDPMYVYFESDSNSFLRGGQLVQGEQAMKVRVGLAGESGYPRQGRVDFVDNRVNGDTGTLQYRAVVPNPDGALRPGQFARVEMPTDHLAQALLVDRKAVLTDQDRRYVYVVDVDNKAARRNVEPGRQVDDLVVINDGLSAGDLVIINGLQKVMGSGMEVAPQAVSMSTDSHPLPAVAAAQTDALNEESVQ